MANMDVGFHNVAKIELCNRFVSNSGCRRIRFTDKAGQSFEMTLYGETAALDALPKSADFQDYDATEMAA